jgi:hypothetical protein
MTEMVLDTKTLPESLFRLLKVEKVKVSELDGEVRLIPIIQSPNSCPFLGVASDCGFTVDDFMARKRSFYPSRKIESHI